MQQSDIQLVHSKQHLIKVLNYCMPVT